MEKRTIETVFILTGKEEYINVLNEVTAALIRACEAKKEFDALFGKTLDSPDGQTSSDRAPCRTCEKSYLVGTLQNHEYRCLLDIPCKDRSLEESNSELRKEVKENE